MYSSSELVGLYYTISEFTLSMQLGINHHCKNSISNFLYSITKFHCTTFLLHFHTYSTTAIFPYL